MLQHNLVRNAHVDVIPMKLARDKVAAKVIINDTFEHEFSPKSRISKHLDMMEPADLAARLSGGAFFFIDGTLVDFRDQQYAKSGFIHSDETIDVFMNVLGVELVQDGGRRNRRQRSEDFDDVKFALRKSWDESPIIVPGYAQGGEFNSSLKFVWNPFVKTVNSSLELVRLICANGMVGLTSWLNTKIPLFNRWEEHLDIASRQIQNRVNDTVTERVQQMTNERASVADCLLLEQHCADRVTSGGEKATGERSHLLKLMNAASARVHLAKFYTEELFRDKNLAAQVPSHLTTFDVYNIATEISSHTTEAAKSTNNALDRMANRLMFDNDRDYAVTSMSAAKLAAFSSPEQAFFGNVH